MDEQITGVAPGMAYPACDIDFLYDEDDLADMPTVKTAAIWNGTEKLPVVEFPKELE